MMLRESIPEGCLTQIYREGTLRKSLTHFAEKIITAGYRAGVYSSSNVYNFDIKTSALDKDIFIWVADYNSKVTYLGRYDIWQYTKTAAATELTANMLI